MEKRLLAPDLFRYLVELASLLKAAGETHAAEQVLHVSMFASGSTSELYGEARLLLPTILKHFGKRLSEPDAIRLRSVIEGVERELGLVGGA